MHTHILNLLPDQEKQKRRVDALNYYTLTAGIVLVTGALALAGILLLFDQVYRTNLASLQQERSQVESQSAAYLDVEKEAKNLELQLANLQKANQQTTHWASLIAALRSFTPPSVSIETLEFQPPATTADAPAAQQNHSRISGSADSRRSLGQFQLALSESPFLKNVEIETTTLNEKLVQYSISMEVDYQKLEGPAT
ncbi:MAG: PilN domain-containing protein [bacterium]|nr:PilN domain-containing protein [bacterium]